jgi:hypothetical protein
VRALPLVVLGCYAHAPSTRTREPPSRPPLVAPMTGRYRIEADGAPVGHETFTITSSAGVWRVRGDTIFDGPLDHRQGYMLAVDARSAEPIAFEAWIEVMGTRRTARGFEKDGAFEVSVRGVGSPEKRTIAYAPGTVIAFGTPLFHVLSMSLLVEGLESKKPVDVRTIALSLPMLSPVVTLQTYALHERIDGIAKVESKLAAAKAPTALWVRRDGLPIKVRTIDAQGHRVDMLLE